MWGEGTHQAILSDFSRHLYWNAAPDLSTSVILYMAFLLNISKWERGGGGLLWLGPFFYLFIFFELRLVMLAAAWLLLPISC